MHQPAVHWYEGMFLRPQHFQASDRFWSQSLQQAIAWRRAYAYGLQSVQWSAEALGAYQFQLTSYRIALRDGTLVKLPPGAMTSAGATSASTAATAASAP